MPKGQLVSESGLCPRVKKRKATERRHVYGNEIPAMGPQRFGKPSFDGVEETRERFQVTCHICEGGWRRG